MQKEYSFKDSSRITTQYSGYDKKHKQPEYSSNKISRDAWTDMRVQEIKKKYQTPTYHHRKSQVLASNSDKLNESYLRTPTKKMVDSGVYSKCKMGNNHGDKSNYKQYSENRCGQAFDDQNVPSFGMQTKERASYGTSVKSMHSIKMNKNTHRPELRDIHNTRNYGHQAIDPRVQNIDKINMKIKKILECLHENQNYIKQQKDQGRASFLREEVLSRGEHSQQLEQTQILSRQKIGDHKRNEAISQSRRDITKQLFNSKQKNLESSRYKMRDSTPSYYHKFQSKPKQVLYSNSAQINKRKIQSSIKNSGVRDTAISSFIKNNKNDSGYHKSGTNWKENKEEPIINRSKSCLGGFKNEQLLLSSGKKLDDQITKINQRIRQSEEQKKRLNIQFKPYNYELKRDRSTSTLVQKSQRSAHRPPLPKSRLSQLSHKYQRSELPSASYHYNNRIKTEQQCDNDLSQYSKKLRQRSKQRNSFKLEDQEQAENQKQIENKDEPEKILFRNPSFQGDINDDSFGKKNSDTQQQSKDYLQDEQTNILKHKTQQGIENRKMKLLQTATVTFARQTKRLIQSLFEQVKLDQQLRNSKIWFRDRINKQKWSELQNQLSQRQGCTIQGQIKHQFEVTQQQDNPFFSARQNPSSINQLVQHWKKANDHWKQEIRHQYNLKQFQKEKFTCDKMDLQKKGYFSVEDLVRFLNMETGTFYRNRDLVLVFKRLTLGKKIDWKSFQVILDQKSQQ